MDTTRTTHRVGEYTRALGIVAVATTACLALRSHLESIDVVMLLLLGVVAAASRSRRGPALAAALLSIAVFDFCFVPPYYTFNVLDTGYYLTFAVMLAVAVTMSGLTSRIRAQREGAAIRERRTAALYAMESDLAAAVDLEAMRRAAEQHLGAAIEGSARIHLPHELDEPGTPRLPLDPALGDPASRIAGRWAIAARIPTGWGTGNGRDVEARLVPLPAGPHRTGIAVLAPSEPGRVLDAERQETLEAMLDLAANGLERRLLAIDTERARAEAEAERLRSAILSSLSHDLRTPLAGIEGAATSLLDEGASLPSDVRRDLLEGILQESQRMSRLVRNLLDMVRVETGTLTPQSSWQPIEEVIGVALLRLESRLAAHPVTTRIPADLPMVRIDELLLEQVLLNLLENAARYAPVGTPIEIRASRQEDALLIEVADRGPGVAPEEAERVFERFYRGSAATGSHEGGVGAGLGLTICRGIVIAHGGTIWIEPRAGGGSIVRFTLPTDGAPVEPVPPADD